MNRLVWLISLIICCLYISACKKQVVPYQLVSESTPISSAQMQTVTADHTMTLTPSPSETHVPPTITPSSTNTTTNTPTFTATRFPSATAASLSDVVQHLDTPEKLSQFLLNEIEYSDHGGCISYWPDVFYQKRQGNCKDYSTFSSYVLAQHGYEAKRVVFVFYRGGVQHGHEVASYEINDTLWIMSNGVIQGPFESLSNYFDNFTWGDYPTLLCIKPPGGVTCCRP